MSLFKSFIGGIMVSIILFLAVCISADENRHLQQVEELCGTWSNKEYDQKENHARWDFNPDGTWACFSTISSSTPTWKGTYVISEKWSDDDENVWYKIFWQDTNFEINGYGLIRIFNSGSTLESAHSSWFYPKKIDKKLPFWHYAGNHYRR